MGNTILSHLSRGYKRNGKCKLSEGGLSHSATPRACIEHVTIMQQNVLSIFSSWFLKVDLCVHYGFSLKLVRGAKPLIINSRTPLK